MLCASSRFHNHYRRAENSLTVLFFPSSWSNWLSSGSSGDLDKCPICKADVGARASITQRATVTRADTAGAALLRRPNSTGAEVDTESDNDDEHTMTPRPMTNLNTGCRNSAMRLYDFDRNFRLTRLNLRYPECVRTGEIRRYRDFSAFVNASGPARNCSEEGGERDNSGACRSPGFGGGSSGGGRGGTW